MNLYLRKILEVIAKDIPNQENILEIGSRLGRNQKKIANLRNLFHYKNYIGSDVRSGNGVDRVFNSEKIPYPDNYFSLVLCLETIEHLEKPWLVAEEINRVMKKDGICIISTQQNFPIHMHPSDNFRFTPYGLASLFRDMSDKLIFTVTPYYGKNSHDNSQTVMLIAWKKRNKLQKITMEKHISLCTRTISGHKPYRHRFNDFMIFMKKAYHELFFRYDIRIWKE